MDEPLAVVTLPMTHPDAIALLAEMAAEVSALYGRGDRQRGLAPALFEPPDGAFLVAYQDGVPVGCAGWRRVDERTAQVHRVFVRPQARGCGLARRLMAEVETRASGYLTLRLHTGVRQPAAMRLYESLGYEPIALFAPYEDDPLSRCYAKAIGEPTGRAESRQDLGAPALHPQRLDDPDQHRS